MSRARVADRIAEALLPLALLAVGLALALPSDGVAARGDLVLALLVVLTALGIAPDELWALRSRWQQFSRCRCCRSRRSSRSPGS